MEKQFDIVENSSLRWVHAVSPQEKDVERLGAEFDLHPLDMKDMLPPLQRPKLEERENYLFLILLLPVYNRTTRKVSPIEVDVAVGRNFLITSSSADLFALDQLFKEYLPHKKKKAHKELPASPGALLYLALSTLEHYCYPMLTHISNDIDAIEGQIFEVNRAANIHEILRIKTNIVNFRKAMNRHTRVIRQCIEKAGRFFSVDELSAYFNDLVEHTEDIWGMLENYSDTIDAVHESHVSLLNLRSNQMMQTFTLFTSIIFSLTLVAAAAGLRLSGNPLTEIPQGFWLVVGAMAIMGLGMLGFFKLRRWM